MGTLDMAVITVWLLLTLAAGVWFSRRASTSTEDFFVSGRSLPWWVVGTSMVATTFAADTPLAVAGWVASKGIAENWIWWIFGFSGITGVFLFSRLWRRAKVITDAELIELRYGGTLGRILRAVKAVWSGVFFNVLVMAWVMRAMTKIFAVIAGWSPDATLEDVLPSWATSLPGWLLGLPADTSVVLVLFVLTVLYTAASGLWGVVATDLVQFVLAMIGAVVLAVLAWQAAGGLSGLQEGFSTHGFNWSQTTRLLPTGDTSGLDLGFASVEPDGQTLEFFIFIGVLWWARPNIDGGGYLTQRLSAAKDDRHALLAYLWFTVAMLVMRPWPWVVVGLAGMALLGPVADPEHYYPLMMIELLPAGLFGLMVASFLAAFMSTIDTHLNWGASLVVNDIYRRYLRPNAPDSEHLIASRVAVIGLALLGAAASFWITNIGEAWKLAIAITAGMGAVYVARWYWWRTNAWSELSAMLVALICTYGFSTLALHHPENVTSAVVSQAPQTWMPGLAYSLAPGSLWPDPQPALLASQAVIGQVTASDPWLGLNAVYVRWLSFPFSVVATVMISIPIWLTVTFITPAVDRAHLRAFYDRVRPGGPGWRAIAADHPHFATDGPGRGTAVAILSGIGASYGALLGTGWLLLGHVALAAGALAVTVVCVGLFLTVIRGETGMIETSGEKAK